MDHGHVCGPGIVGFDQQMGSYLGLISYGPVKGSVCKCVRAYISFKTGNALNSSCKWRGNQIVKNNATYNFKIPKWLSKKYLSKIGKLHI